MEALNDHKSMLGIARLLEHAARHPLYECWDFSGVNHVGDGYWQRLPTLARDRFRGCTLPPTGEQGEIMFFSTGTTGAPKLLRYSRLDLDRVADLCARFAALEGVTCASRVMVLLPMALWSVGKLTVEGHRRAGAHVFPVDLHGGIPAWQRMTSEIRPTVISSTPSVLAAWAPYYEQLPLELVETTGEPLLVRERHLIEAKFGGRVHDAYGLTECVVGVECAMRDGFHYWPDATGVEILALDSDAPIPPGDTGEIVLTSLMQSAMPVIRYRSGDLGRRDVARCPCGDPRPLVRVHGRVTPTLHFPRGVKLDYQELCDACVEIAAGARVRYKGAPGSPAAAYVAEHFRPTLEIRLPTVSAIDWEALRTRASIPELAELVHEHEILLSLVPAQRG